MTDVEVWCPDRDLSTLTLDQLAQAAADEYRQTEAHLVGALGHFVRFGEILRVVRDRVPEGEWKVWCTRVADLTGRTFSLSGCNDAMRLAQYRDRLPAELWQPYTNHLGRTYNASPRRALRYLAGLPDIRSKGTAHYSADVKAEARRLRATGMSCEHVADLLSVSASSVRGWVDPEYQKRHEARKNTARNERRRAARALREEREREERDRLAKATGGELAEAYSLIRRALAAADKAGATDTVTHLTRAEVAITAVMRQARTA